MRPETFWPYADETKGVRIGNEARFHHDRALRHANLNGGIGFDLVVSDRYSISATCYATIEQDIVAKVESAFTLTLTRLF